MKNAVAIFLSFLISFQVVASVCSEIREIERKLQEIEQDTSINGDLNFLTFSFLFGKLSSENPKVKAEAVKEVNEFITDFRNSPMESKNAYMEFANKIKSDQVRTSIRDFFLERIDKCRVLLSACIEGLNRFRILINEKFQTSRDVVVPEFSVSPDGSIVMGRTKKQRLTLLETPNLPQAKDRIISLSSNLAEAGNIKTREGLGAIRAEPLLRERFNRPEFKLEESDTKGSDFQSVDTNGTVTMRYSLKGPFLSERLTESFFELRYEKAKKYVDDFLAGREKRYNRMQKDVKRFLERSGKVDQFDMKNPKHQELFIHEYANKMFKQELKQSINSIKKDLKKNPGHTLIVDLLGFSEPVKQYIKSQIQSFIATEGITGYKAENILWVY